MDGNRRVSFGRAPPTQPANFRPSFARVQGGWGYSQVQGPPVFNNQTRRESWEQGPPAFNDQSRGGNNDRGRPPGNNITDKRTDDRRAPPPFQQQRSYSPSGFTRESDHGRRGSWGYSSSAFKIQERRDFDDRGRRSRSRSRSPSRTVNTGEGLRLPRFQPGDSYRPKPTEDSSWAMQSSLRQASLARPRPRPRSPPRPAELRGRAIDGMSRLSLEPETEAGRRAPTPRGPLPPPPPPPPPSSSYFQNGSNRERSPRRGDLNQWAPPPRFSPAFSNSTGQSTNGFPQTRRGRSPDMGYRRSRSISSERSPPSGYFGRRSPSEPPRRDRQRSPERHGRGASKFKNQSRGHSPGPQFGGSFGYGHLREEKNEKTKRNSPERPNTSQHHSNQGRSRGGDNGRGVSRERSPPRYVRGDNRGRGNNDRGRSRSPQKHHKAEIKKEAETKPSGRPQLKFHLKAPGKNQREGRSQEPPHDFFGRNGNEKSSSKEAQKVPEQQQSRSHRSRSRKKKTQGGSRKRIASGEPPSDVESESKRKPKAKAEEAPSVQKPVEHKDNTSFFQLDPSFLLRADTLGIGADTNMMNSPPPGLKVKREHVQENPPDIPPVLPQEEQNTDNLPNAEEPPQQQQQEEDEQTQNGLPHRPELSPQQEKEQEALLDNIAPGPMSLAPIQSAPIQAAPMQAIPMQAAPIQAAPMHPAPMMTHPQRQQQMHQFPPFSVSQDQSAQMQLLQGMIAQGYLIQQQMNQQMTMANTGMPQFNQMNHHHQQFGNIHPMRQGNFGNGFAMQQQMNYQQEYFGSRPPQRNVQQQGSHHFTPSFSQPQPQMGSGQFPQQQQQQQQGNMGYFNNAESQRGYGNSNGRWFTNPRGRWVGRGNFQQVNDARVVTSPQVETPPGQPQPTRSSKDSSSGQRPFPASIKFDDEEGEDVTFFLGQSVVYHEPQ